MHIHQRRARSSSTSRSAAFHVRENVLNKMRLGIPRPRIISSLSVGSMASLVPDRPTGMTEPLSIKQILSIFVPFAPAPAVIRSSSSLFSAPLHIRVIMNKGPASGSPGLSRVELLLLSYKNQLPIAGPPAPVQDSLMPIFEEPGVY